MNLIDKTEAIKKKSLAALPTPVFELKRISSDLGKKIWIKRDDLTGVETSGNKIRKLEYVVAKAIADKADVLITCGGIQSNHARATAAVAARLGLLSHLVLSVSQTPEVEGNYLVDKILGARITLLNEKQEKCTLTRKMEQIAAAYLAEGLKPFVIPVGASDGLGSFGYIEAMREISLQEKQIGVRFDAVCCATGSGGTYAGLYLGNRIYDLGKRVVGITVCDNREYFERVCAKITEEVYSILGENKPADTNFEFIDGYKGLGYAISKEDELRFISEVASKEGILLDPVYTGKAFYGMYNEIKKGYFERSENILFVHTGGQYGVFPKREQFSEIL